MKLEMVALNYLWITGVVSLYLSSCSPSTSSLSQSSPTKTPTEDTEMNQDEFSLPVKKKAPPSPESEELSRSELLLPNSYAQGQSLPLINQLEQLNAYDGQQVRLVGKYVESDVRMRPTGTPRYVGHVSIVLSDNTHVSLFPIWDQDARRPKEEIDSFKDQEVEVIGTFYLQAPVDPSGGASPLSPCLTDIKAIYLSSDSQ